MTDIRFLAAVSVAAITLILGAAAGQGLSRGPVTYDVLGKCGPKEERR